MDIHDVGANSPSFLPFRQQQKMEFTMNSDRERFTIQVEEALLGHNVAAAAMNRKWFAQAGVKAINIVSSPGSGKTSLLERTLTDLKDQLKIGVMAGDLQTDNDAQRLRGKGAPVVQITTGTYCHLEAEMVASALKPIHLDELDLLIIENVGNLVCPASYDLGESIRVTLISVTEGEDKPLKYPPLFHTADMVLITKTDLAEAVELNIELLRANIRTAAPRAKIIELSAKTGAGMNQWYEALDRLVHLG